MVESESPVLNSEQYHFAAKKMLEPPVRQLAGGRSWGPAAGIFRIKPPGSYGVSLAPFI